MHIETNKQGRGFVSFCMTRSSSMGTMMNLSVPTDEAFFCAGVKLLTGTNCDLLLSCVVVHVAGWYSTTRILNPNYRMSE